MQNDISIQRGETQPECTKKNEARKHATPCGTWRCLRSCLGSQLAISEHQGKGSVTGHRNWTISSSISQTEPQMETETYCYQQKANRLSLSDSSWGSKDCQVRRTTVLLDKEGCLVWQFQGYDSNSGQRQIPSQIVPSINSVPPKVVGQKEELIWNWNIGWFKWFFPSGSPVG